MKNGFSLVMAVVFMVILAILGMMALNFATKAAKQTTNIYLREQAELLAISATEFAVMAMQDHDYSVNCLENVTVTYPDKDNPMFVATVDIYYFDSRLKNCSNIVKSNPAGATLGPNPTNMAMLDTVVVNNPAVLSEPIRYFKRTIQVP